VVETAITAQVSKPMKQLLPRPLWCLECWAERVWSEQAPPRFTPFFSMHLGPDACRSFPD
jgi:hypothetical protein